MAVQKMKSEIEAPGAREAAVSEVSEIAIVTCKLSSNLNNFIFITGT